MTLELKFGGGHNLPIIFPDSGDTFFQPLVTMFDSQNSIDFGIIDTSAKETRYFRIINKKGLNRKDPFSTITITKKIDSYPCKTALGQCLGFRT